MYLQMANKPNYAEKLAAAAQEQDPDKKASLLREAYFFPEEVTPEERELFDYMQEDYVQDHPRVTPGNREESYVGVKTLADLDNLRNE